MTSINEQAPVVGSSEIEIAAPAELAWDVLTAIDRWPSWNSDVKSATIQSAVEEGAEFKWKAGPGTIKSTIEEIDAPRRIVWSGTTFGIKAIHVHTLEARNGTTLVTSEESYDGLLARLFSGRLKKMLENALQNGLQRLKAEAERLR